MRVHEEYREDLPLYAVGALTSDQENGPTVTASCHILSRPSWPDR